MDFEQREEPPPPKLVAEVFPLEIWSEIFTYLDSPQDLTSIFNTSQVWRGLLSPKKVFPIIFPHLSNKEVLNCRLINPNWNEVVDNFFKFHPAHYDIGISTPPPQLPKHPLFKQYAMVELPMLLEEPIGDTNLPNSLTVARYLKYHEEYTGFHGPPSNTVSLNRENLTKVVKKYGSEIWHFDLSLAYSGSAQHQQIRTCLKHLPNLKTLSIAATSNKNFAPETGRGSPKLGGLVKLRTNLNGILNYQGFGVKSSLQKLRSEALQPNLELGALEQLFTKLYTADDLQNLGDLQAPLKVLKLEACFCLRTVNLSTIFQALTHFGSTLKEFYFEHYVADGEETWEGLELRLPELQTLTFNVGNHRLESVDFLLPCVSLEKLSVDGCGDFKDNYRVERGLVPEINLFEFESSMYSSNIWERLPKLKLLEINDRYESYSYSRTEWERMQRV